MDTNNILFYSNKCTYCKEIIQLINKVDDISRYKLINIDNNSSNFPYIQRVPTLLVSDLKKPIVGVNAFNWIKSQSQFNKQTNNINFNANNNLDPKINNLIYEKKEKMDGSEKKIENFSYLNEDSNMDKIHKFYDTKTEKIYTLPEGERINQNIQKKKLNKLVNLRNQQDTVIFNDTDTSMSTHNNIIEEQLKVKNNSKNTDLNVRMNNVNFSVPLSNDIKPTSNIEFFGIQTPRTVINKSNIKN
jgi:hypothetical protein